MIQRSAKFKLRTGRTKLITPDIVPIINQKHHQLDKEYITTTVLTDTLAYTIELERIYYISGRDSELATTQNHSSTKHAHLPIHRCTEKAHV
jgi:hypothetical protein